MKEKRENKKQKKNIRKICTNSQYNDLENRYHKLLLLDPNNRVRVYSTFLPLPPSSAFDVSADVYISTKIAVVVVYFI